MAKLIELAEVIRSKNASPFVTSVDLFFSKPENFEMVKRSNILTKERIAELYRVPVENVLGIWYVDACYGIKVSFIKAVAADEPGCPDVYAAQQHIPLLDVEVPEAV